METHSGRGRVVIRVMAVVTMVFAWSGVSSAWAEQPKRVVYLTFDDGPALDSATGSLLELLAHEGVTATFFVVGSNVERNPQMIDRIVGGGHALGNHSYSHQRLNTMTVDQIRTDLSRNQTAVDRAGGPVMTCYRPPFGATSSQVRSVGAALGMSEELWSFNFQDWERLDPSDYAEQLTNVVDGDVVLLHDGFVDGENTVEAVRQFLRSEGDEIEFRALPGCMDGTPSTTQPTTTTEPATTTTTTTTTVSTTSSTVSTTTTEPTTTTSPSLPVSTTDPASLAPSGGGGVTVVPPCRLGPADELVDPTSAIEGAVFRMYCSHLGRHPDRVGFEYWLRIAVEEHSLYPLSYSFLVSTEFVTTYGQLGEVEFLDTVYANVLGRQPDRLGLDYWLAQLDAGVSRSMVMLSFSESTEFRAATGTS